MARVLGAVGPDELRQYEIAGRRGVPDDQAMWAATKEPGCSSKHRQGLHCWLASVSLTLRLASLSLLSFRYAASLSSTSLIKGDGREARAQLACRQERHGVTSMDYVSVSCTPFD